jgi:formiminotetrahydrofolate cyclodeaminase
VETLEAYLAALASAQPTPGGGSATALIAASGAALLAMVARITLGNPKYGEKHVLAHAIVERADALRALLLAAREIDESAYGAVVAAMEMPRATDDQKTLRAKALQGALAQAASAPLEAAFLSLQTLELAERCLALENAHLVSDVGCAAEFAATGVRAASYNVRINHVFLKDAELMGRQETELERLERSSLTILERVRTALTKSLQSRAS